MFQKSSTDDIEKIASTSESSFSDIDEDSALAATINAYYNLLPDETEGIFNGNAVTNLLNNTSNFMSTSYSITTKYSIKY